MDHESDWATVLSGVPQGSVLGPLLFLVFINDLPELVTNFCKLFADDIKLIGIVKNSLDQKILQEDIDKLVRWSKRWNMEFNEGKCNEHLSSQVNSPYVEYGELVRRTSVLARN